MEFINMIVGRERNVLPGADSVEFGEARVHANASYLLELAHDDYDMWDVDANYMPSNLPA